MGTWKKRSFNNIKEARAFKEGLKKGGVSTTYNIPKIKGKHIVEYKE